MARDRTAGDITRGSMWQAREGQGGARVISTQAGYVCFEDANDGATKILHHHRFRDRYAEPYDARALRSQFEMSLSNLDEYHAFWSPSKQKLYARSASAGAPGEVRGAARGRPALPDDAEFVGTYSNDAAIATPQWHRRGMTVFEAFIDDLHDVLARIFRRTTVAG